MGDGFGFPEAGAGALYLPPGQEVEKFRPGELPSTFHLVSIGPGQSRGHHLHPGQAEYLYPFHGRAVFTWEAAPGQVRERVISGDRTLIHIPPGLAHAVTNPGPELLYLMAWREVAGPGPGEPETVPHPLGG